MAWLARGGAVGRGSCGGDRSLMFVVVKRPSL